jgi:AGCS family alanine or glycine:cation symporter
VAVVFDSIEGIGRNISEFVDGKIGPSADFMDHFVWQWPGQPLVPLLVVLLVGAGIYVTARLALIQIRGFRHAIDITRGRYDNPEDAGDLNHFQALTTALSATVGIGNIAGVAIAIRLGGPGALMWMWITAFFGMALKYVECTLALMHRKVHPDGSVSGGPMYYIELGMGKHWKWLAYLFAFFAFMASFGGGCMNQSNTLADQVHSSLGIPTVFTALVFSALVALVIIGGIRRIGKVTAILAPSMALMYVSAALIIVIMNITDVPAAFALIFQQAFAPTALAGGAVGSIYLTMMQGIRRGLFSNEAGQGSAPFAHATAKTKEPVREGLVASIGPFIDTLMICTMTGLVIILTGAFTQKVDQELNLSALEIVLVETARDTQLLDLRAELALAGPQQIQVVDGRLVGASFVTLDSIVEQARLETVDALPWSGRLLGAAVGSVAAAGGHDPPVVMGAALLNGAPLTAHGFTLGLGRFGTVVVTLAVVLFALSTGISWSY